MKKQERSSKVYQTGGWGALFFVLNKFLYETEDFFTFVWNKYT